MINSLEKVDIRNVPYHSTITEREIQVLRDFFTIRACIIIIESPFLFYLTRITIMISCTYIPIVIMPHDITGITFVEALILILLLTVMLVLFMKFIIWYMHHII